MHYRRDTKLHPYIQVNGSGRNLQYRSTIAGSFKNNSKNKKRKKYEIMKRDKQK